MFDVIPLDWVSFKAALTAKYLLAQMQWTEDANTYAVFAYDMPMKYACTIWKGSAPYEQEANAAALAEFEATYKAASNRRITGSTSVEGPKEEDGKAIVVISPATEGMKTWLTGRGDDLGAGPSGRGKGAKLKIAFDGTEGLPATKTVEVQFLEPVEVQDGQFNWDVTTFGADDHFSVSVVMPGSIATSTPGTGNANEVQLGGGAVLFVPAANDGSHTVDLSDWTKAVPVPASGAGYWDVDDDGVITPSATPGAADWHMVNFSSEVFLIAEVGMQNSLGLFDVDVYKTEWIHPAWKVNLSVTKSSAGAGTASGWLLTFRTNVSRT